MSEQIVDLLSEGELVEIAPFACLPDAHLPDARLPEGGFDVVLVDLEGSVPTVLDLIGRLRAAVHPGVAFVGILPASIDPVARLYLSAVVDALVDERPCGVGLHDAVRQALIAEHALTPLCTDLPTRH